MTKRQRETTEQQPAFERSLPHNLEAERSVLGAILVHSSAFSQIEGKLTADDFYRDAHRRIFTALSTLISDRRIDADFVTLKEELTRTNQLDEVGGPAYVSSLADGVPRATNITYYAGIVREKATLRRLIFAANKILTDAYAAEDSLEEQLRAADRHLLDVQRGMTAGRMVSMAAGTVELFTDLASRRERRGQLTGITTGYKLIDELTFGWQRGEVVVIAARPSIGKTTLAVNCAVHAARAGARVAVISLEMRRRQLEYRILSSLAQVDLTRMVSGYTTKPEDLKLADALEAMHALPLSIDDKAGQNVYEIRTAARRLKLETGLDLLIVDYFQLMPGTLARKGATRNEELTDISRRFTEVSDELSVPVVLLSQLRRLDGRRPGLEDLRECGALEQDASVVGILHRKNHREDGPTEFILAKQRNGPTGTVMLSIQRDTTTFTEMDEDEARRLPAEQPTQKKKKFIGGKWRTVEDAADALPMDE